MKIDNLEKLTDLSQKLDRLKWEQKNISESYRVSLVYVAPKYKGGPATEDKYIVIPDEAVSRSDQRDIVQQLKFACLEKIHQKILAVQSEIESL